MYDTSYLNMQRLSAGIFSILFEFSRESSNPVPYRSITADILEWHRFLKPNALLSSADIRKCKHSPFSYENLTLLIQICLLSLRRISF